MKKKLAVLSVIALLTLSACGGDDPKPGPDPKPVDPAGELIDGYTSLKNQHSNGAIDADGKYEAGGIKFETKNEYKTTYTTEPAERKFNYLANQWTYNSYHYCNMVDGLVENDKYGGLVGALAIGYKTTLNADGTETWSFQLRENATWVKNNDGSKYADVVADDFVAAAEYVLDPFNGSPTSNLIRNFVAGADNYYKAMAAHEADETKPEPSFGDVGIKAVSKYVIEYTLITSTPYFASVLTYSPYLPVNREYLESSGTAFGESANDILVNGAFRITTHEFESKMIYTKNASYYDKDHVYVDTVTRTYVPNGSPLNTSRLWYEAGVIDAFGVSNQDAEGWAKYVTGPDGTGSVKNPYDPSCNAIQSYYDATYIGFFNFNRTFYEYSSEAHAKTAAEKTDTIEALINKDFRKGILYGMDVLQYLLLYGEERAVTYLMRGYTNKELCGAGGKDYTDFVNEVFNEKQGTTGKSLIGIDNGSDPVYNLEKSRAAFTAAYEELKDTVSFPIYVDFLGDQQPVVQAYNEAMLASLELSSTITVNGQEIQMIRANFNIPTSDDQETLWGSTESNYDLSMWSGWGPDYADPNTYMHTFSKYGDNFIFMGLPGDESAIGATPLSPYAPAKYQALVEGEDESKAVKALVDDIFDDYQAKYEAANAIVDGTKLEERYRAFAEAEYELIFEQALIIPWLSPNGYSQSVSKTVPWQAGRASYGLTGDKFKNVVVTTAAITKEQRAAVTAEYEAGKGA